MPEGHTLHRLATAVREHFAGRTVSVTSPQGRFAESARLIDGTELVTAESWGKHLFVEFAQERIVHVHLGLYGKLDVHDGPPPPPVGQVRLRLVAGAPRPSYADLRGATACDLLTVAQRDAILDRLGPDPLRPDADPARAWDAGQPQPGPDRRAADGPGRARRRRQRLPGRGAVPAPGPPAAPGRHPAPRPVRLDVGGPGDPDARGGARPAASTPCTSTTRPRRWAGRHGSTPTGARSTSTGAPGSPATSAAAPSAPPSCQGRNLFWCPRCQPTFRSRAASR